MIVHYKYQCDCSPPFRAGLPTSQAETVFVTDLLRPPWAETTNLAACNSNIPPVVDIDCRIDITVLFYQLNGIYQLSNQEDLLEVFLRKRHSVSKLVVHLIFTTNYRRKLFDGQMPAQLREVFGSAAAKLECEIIEMDGEPDYVHLLIAYHPNWLSV